LLAGGSVQVAAIFNVAEVHQLAALFECHLGVSAAGYRLAFREGTLQVGMLG
jgi:hypothetical protein